MTKIGTATTFGIVLALAGVAFATGKGDRAPDFELKDASGTAVKLSALKDKVVFVDFWATWCEPCKKELPALDKLAGDYKDKDVVILAVNIDKDRKNADAFIKQHKITNLTIVFDAQGGTPEKYGPDTMPTSYVVDKKGIVKHVNNGFNPGDEKGYRTELDGLLK